ncbi:alpha/beta hydrolase [Acidiferrimicrobium sp. IK]|uniref:alpha/beta fold hydrolase n=1 Tax=Acidiferrimicrobium sp. IK TaxID=2871700 RepID=UPI0021CB81D1|nr:alpha/beta hydrolase [Acidiferrimicrobium sp. IK]MCU4184987.1 alpha/beta hydrolase [Acidiferrimicrobium sp. IK]
MPNRTRRSLIGLGIGAVGVAGAGLAGQVLARRALPALEARAPGARPAGIREQRLRMDDGASLRVLQAGPDPTPGSSRPPVVLLHGITLGADIWHRQMSDLAGAGHPVVAYDMRGHGGSDGAQLTFARLVADLEEVLSQLDLARVVLVGHSMGGMIAIKALSSDRVTASGRGRVAALGLVATSANPVSGSGVPGARVVARTLQPLLARTAWLASRIPGPTLPKADLAYLLARVNFGDDPLPSEVALTQQLVTDVRAHVTGELIVEILRFDDLAALRHVDLPAAVVVGTRDLVTPVRHGRALADAIGGAELTVLEGCGHMVMNERPAELLDAITDLAARIPPADRRPAGAAR